ncbi:MAG TPA: hypothetical protein VFT62_03370 [Mycobacteriales bacterium]|nr:hypothetical protein [Mycobacteriales bacterium]
MTWCKPNETMYTLFGLHNGGWQRIRQFCFAEPPQNAAPPRVTAAMVLRAFRQVPLPESRSIAQPAGKTLVNFETIFHADAESFTRTVTLLGQRVQLDIRPSRFHWVFGDGASEDTATAGAPYPSKEIVHKYLDAHVTVEHHLEVTWAARYSVNGGPWRDVPGTVTRTGPATALRIAEATPALSGEGH